MSLLSGSPIWAHFVRIWIRDLVTTGVRQRPAESGTTYRRHGISFSQSQSRTGIRSNYRLLAKALYLKIFAVFDMDRLIVREL